MNQKYSLNISLDVSLMVENVTRDKNGTTVSVIVSVKHHAYEGDYAWNPSTCACECDQDCDMRKYLTD